MSNLEQQVPSLNTCLSLLARGITMMTVFCWARDDDGNFLVVSMYGAHPDRHVTPLCNAPRSKELLQALLDLEPKRFDASCMALFDQPERLAGLLLEAPMADYEHMSLGSIAGNPGGQGHADDDGVARLVQGGGCRLGVGRPAMRSPSRGAPRTSPRKSTRSPGSSAASGRTGTRGEAAVT